jgi:hypothetical protein
MPSRFSALVLLTVAAAARAGEEERRSFAVSVDRKPAGANVLVIQTRDDGSVAIASQADVSVRIAVVSYKYTFRGTEVWQGDRLAQLATATNDDGKKHNVSAERTKDGLLVKADGKESLLKGDVWTTTYWKLPPEGRRGPEVTLLDADTGRPIAAKMEKVGLEKLTVLGKPLDCAHYRLTGGVQVDLWYDGSDRMVRQEMVEQGHRTVMELTQLQRD